MAKSKVPVTFAFGRRDRVDPKLAPFGVLKLGRNLRVRKDGRLGARHGFEPLDMGTRYGELVAYDLHEYLGRLLAFGSDGGDGYPTDLFEFLGLPNGPWRATDAIGRRPMLNPFTNLREVAGIPQPENGVSILDAAADGGFVCLVYQPAGSTRLYALIVDAETDQVIHQECLTNGGPFTSGAKQVRVVGLVKRFYIGVVSATNAVSFARYRVGNDVRFSSFGALITAGAAVPAFDMCVVRNATTGRIAFAYDRAGADVNVVVLDTSGNQVGSTIAISGTTTLHLALDVDQTDDTINLYTVETATTGQLRTFDFAGALLNGPTAMAAGATGFITRLPAQLGFPEHVAVAVNTASHDIVVSFRDVDTHVETDAVKVQQAVCTGRPLPGQSVMQPLGVVLPALVGPNLTTLEFATNALFFVTPNVAHMVGRDYTVAKFTTSASLSFDASTGKICWPAARDPGTQVAMPAVSLLDFQSAERRQSAKYGGLIYYAGASPTVYDGRLNGELGFNEAPGILSATPSSGTGALATSATYSYVVHWEYVLSDGSVEQGPVSVPFEVTTGAADDTMAVVVTTPHTVRLAAGDALFGATVIVVLSRTEWDAGNGIPRSIFRRCETASPSIGIGTYGATVRVTDRMSDAVLAVQEAIYTQATRGALSGVLEHNAPRACSYITATEARLITGGLSRECDAQISKAAFLGEPLAFSEFSSFFSLASGPVLAVHRLDQARLIFTTDTILSLGGEGPDDLGGNALEPPVEIPTPSGIKDSWSILEGPEGLWFQLDDTKLFRIPRGGGAPTWEGVDVEDTLLAFPTITGACKHKQDYCAVFACNSMTDVARTARLVVRDFRTEQWFEDDPFLTDGFGIEAITSYGNTLAYLSGGAVFVQSESSFADGASVGPDGLPISDGLHIDTKLQTQPLYPFGVGGYGQIYELLLTGEYRGDCTLEARVSYDDGVTFTGLADFPLLGLPVGQTVQRKWTLPQDITSSVVLEFSVTESPGGDTLTRTEGFVFNQVDLLVEAEDGLRELSADEMG